MENRKRYYDKFGFLSVEPEKGDGFDKYEQESRNQSRRRSPQHYNREQRERERKYSPDARDYRSERRGEYRNEKSDNNWRNRDYSPRNFSEANPERKRDDQMDFDNWESSFNDFVNPPPAPSFSNEPPPPHFSVTEGYGQQFNSTQSYNFLDTPLPPPPIMMEPPMPTPPPAPTIQQGSWTQVPPAAAPQEDKVKKEAIALEMRNQRATLAKQKEDYLKKVNVLKRELDSLKQQRIELRGDPKRSPSPDSQRFLKENAKLQTEILNKIKSFDNIIDMLNGIIGDAATSTNDGEKSKRSKSSKAKSPGKSTSSRDSSSSDNDKKSSDRKKHKSRSRSKVSEKKFNYVFYDPEMHWCRICNEFPSTAKNYLNHLHSPSHQKNATGQIEAPWHNATTANEGMPSFPGAPTKRTPIKGLQFFVPSTAWYCKLCDQWIGDLHCASTHLKSLNHTQNYANFVDLNPHWEMDWMSDRQKNYEKVHKSSDVEKKPEYSPNTIISFQADGIHTKKKKESSPQQVKIAVPSKSEKKEKKKKEKRKLRKKRHSSSGSQGSTASSSDSDDERKKKKSKKEDNYNKQEDKPSRNSGREEEDSKDNIKQVKDEKESASDDRMISQWMSLKQDTLTDQDKKILERLKNTVKIKSVEKPEQKIDSRVVSREREARDLLSIQGDRARKMVEKMDRYESKSSRKEESNYSKYYSEPKGHMSKREREEQMEDKFDRHSSDKQKKSHKESSSSDHKKMPFIGKMPLFKSLTNKPSRNEPEPPKPSIEECVEAAKKKRDEINAQLQKSVEEMKEKLNKSLAQKEAANSLPAPGLALPTALASAPTPVTSAPKPPAAPYPQVIHRIKKSPVRNTPETKKTTSPQTGGSKGDPLHKDFQDALDIIFPSADSENAVSNPSDIPEPPQPLANPNMNNMYSQEGPPGWMQSQNYMGHMGAMGPNNMGPMGPMGHMGMMGPMGPMGQMGPNMGPMGPMGPMPPMGHPMGYPDQSYPPLPYSMDNTIPESDGMNNRGTIDDDLAMLGIDAEDVGAGGF